MIQQENTIWMEKAKNCQLHGLINNDKTTKSRLNNNPIYNICTNTSMYKYKTNATRELWIISIR